MTAQTTEQLRSKQCGACEGEAEKLTPDQAEVQLKALSGWELTEDGKRISKDWGVQDFAAGMEFLNQVAELAEQEGHHPDLHLENYRHVRIVTWTHALDGLSENDFILAAKIDKLSAQVKA
jgi:4a-hydroxytetrahydrobiopterin dehydratase